MISKCECGHKWEPKPDEFIEDIFSCELCGPHSGLKCPECGVIFDHARPWNRLEDC